MPPMTPPPASRRATPGGWAPRPPPATLPAAAPGRIAALRRGLGGMRLAYVPILATYFCYGASGIIGVALLYFQKDALALTPAEVSGIGFWLGLAWSPE